jgi:hypothetical protein
MKDNSTFLRWLTLLCTLAVIALVAGILFGPFEIDPHAPTLVALVAQPGGVALGYIVGRRKDGE